MKILFIGDVVGPSGKKALEEYLPGMKRRYRPQLTIVNGENITDVGRGINEQSFKWLLHQGVDVVTLGNHAWDNREIFEFIDESNCLVRPINLPEKTPGKGVYYVKVNQHEVAIINVLGSVFMSACIDPFTYLPEVIEEVRQRTPNIFIDFHAEATSEKEALGWFLDGQVSAVVGTHTHVQTNDARILPKGTAYQTDVGMCGSLDSVIGVNPEDAVRKFITQMPTRFTPATSDRLVFSACLVTLDPQTGHAHHIENIYQTSDNVNRGYQRKFE